MTTIIYKIIGKWGEVRNFKSGKGKTLTIVAQGVDNGYITVGQHTSKLSLGAAEFDLSELADGEYYPLLTGKVSATLEPFIKRNSVITPLPTPDKTVRLLLERAETAERQIMELTQKVNELEVLIKGSAIF